MRPGIAGLLAGAVAGGLTMATVAYAAAPTNWNGARIGTSNVALTGCDATTDSIASLRTAYRTTGDRYEIASLIVSSVPAACQSRPYRVNVVDNVTDGAVLTDGVVTGTLDGDTSTTVTITSGSGPQIQDLNDTNDQARIVVIIR